MVTDGEASASVGGGAETPLPRGTFAFFPADAAHRLSSAAGAKLLMYEQLYKPLPDGGKRPAFVHGVVDDQAVLPVAGEVFVLLKMLPLTAEYDFNIHVMDFNVRAHTAPRGAAACRRRRCRPRRLPAR